MGQGNPNPSPENQFKKGPDPRRYVPSGPRKPTLISKLIKMIEDKKLDDTIILVWLGAALGEKKLLQGRNPNFSFFKELLDRTCGKVPDEVLQDITMESLVEYLRSKSSKRRKPPGSTAKGE
jgi:hypothetical protein